MRLKTKLVLAATGVTLLVVLVLAGFFLAELLRQRIEQAVSSNDVLANQVRSATREALQSGLPQALPGNNSEAALFDSVATALRNDDSLRLLMSSIVRYSLTVQDVSVTNSHGITLASTDPDALDQPAPFRTGLKAGEPWKLLVPVAEGLRSSQSTGYCSSPGPKRITLSCGAYRCPVDFPEGIVCAWAKGCAALR